MLRVREQDTLCLTPTCRYEACIVGLQVDGWLAESVPANTAPAIRSDLDISPEPAGPKPMCAVHCCHCSCARSTGRRSDVIAVLWQT